MAGGAVGAGGCFKPAAMSKASASRPWRTQASRMDETASGENVEPVSGAADGGSA
ncbi:MAG: hypothetical protein WDM85_07755 [Caulobacteraceae bacterium]